jgi:phage terminase small subunit
MNRKLFVMLKAKQEAFAEAYAETPNGAEAARAAGYAESGAKQEAVRQLANPEVVARIEELRMQAAERRAESRNDLTRFLHTLLDRYMEKGTPDDVLKTARLLAQVSGVIGH